jgi:hypothetical protein
VTLNGTLPFQWQPLGIPQDGQRNLMVRVPRQSVRHFTDLAGAEASASPIARAATALGQLRDLRGEMEASVTLAGTALRPENAGDFRLFGVAFGIPRAESAVRDLNVHLAFEGDRVTVREFRGESTTGGSFQVSGLVNLGRPEEAAEALDLRMVLQDVRFRSRNLSGLLNERLVGTFRTVDASDPSRAGAIRITGAFQAPQVSGAIHARDTTLTLPAAIPQPTVPPTPPPINPQFNLAMILGANTWLANPSVRLQLVGRLPIAGSLAAPQVRGVLLVQRGTLTLPTARFGVTGEIQVAYAPALAGEDAAPIRVDLEAVGRVRGRDPTTGRSQVYTVTLLARGPLSAAPIEPVGSPIGPPVLFQGTQLGQLSIQASADPPLTQRQIIELIARVEVLQGILAGGGNVDDVLRLEVEQALTTSVVPALFLPFETAVEEALGLSEFAIDVAFREPIQLRLGRQLAGNFWATYARSLTGPVDRYQLELYYRVSPRLRFGYRIEEPFARRTWFLNGTFRF